MENYQSNSHKSKERPDPKVKNVVSGVSERKKSGTQRFLDAVISNGVDNMRETIVDEIVVPKVKEMLSKIAHSVTEGIAESIDRIIYGNDVPKKNESRPYHSYYGGVPAQQAKTVSYRDTGFRSDEYAFQNRGDAELVLNDLRDVIKNYDGAVSVACFYSAIGQTPSSVDNNYGWTDLSKAGIRYTHDGYILILPRPEYIGD